MVESITQGAGCQGGKLPDPSTIDVLKRAVIGLHVFLPDFSECSDEMSLLSLLPQDERRGSVLSRFPYRGVPVVWMEVLS